MNTKNLLFISADKKIAKGAKNNFYYSLLGLATKFQRVNVISPSDDKGITFKLTENINIHPSPFGSKNTQDVWRLKKYIIEKAVSLNEKNPFNIIVCDLKAPLFIEAKAALEVARILKLPLIAEFLHTPGLPESNSSAEVVQKMLVKDFLQLHQREFSMIRVNSLAETKTFLHDELQIAFEKIFASPPYYINREVFKDHNLEREKMSFLFAAPLEKYTGVYQVLEAVKIIKQKYSNVKAYIVGEGELKEELKKYAEEYGIKKNVVFLRWPVSLKSLALQYSKVSAFVMPYFTQLNYRICLEAMSCKTPTIIATNKSNPEFLANEQNTLQFEYGSENLANKLIKIFTDNQLSSKIAINGFETAANFEFKKMLTAYAERYLNLST